MGKKSPDIKGAAKREAASQEAIAREATYADRPDQFTPWGSLTWEQEQITDPATGKPVTRWVQNQEFSPEAQSLYESTMDEMNLRQGARSGILNRELERFGTPADFDQFGDPIGLDFSADEMRQRAEDAAYGRSVMRLDPQFAEQGARLEQKLKSQGLSPGDQAYDAAMANFQRGRNDAYERARLGATAEGRAEASDMFGRAMQENELANALRAQDIEEYIGERQFGLNEADLVGEGSDFGAFLSRIAS